MNNNIYLIGFMGVGKTTVGRILADILGRKFVDMDPILENEFQASIPEVFALQGEGIFRRRESALLKRLSKRRRLVVATGGGVPEKKSNRDLMHESGLIVHLETDFQTTLSRLKPEDKKNRPMWRDKETAEKLFVRRRDLYGDCDLSIRTGNRTPGDIARRIIANLSLEKEFTVRLGQAECPVICTFNPLPALARYATGRKTALVTDRNVARLHGRRYRAVIEPAAEVTLPAGERTKTLKNAQKVYQTLLDNHIDRGDLLVALGGGVITDLGAFTAATYKRGMDFVLVSTTLLGCVDAAVGGKAAVNLGSAKNMVGCFTVPAAVILDLSALATLNRQQTGEGLIEAYKTGLVASPVLAENIERDDTILQARDLAALASAALLSAEAKAGVVGRDFQEQGWRSILNFGHTYGHAVEAWHRFKISHGRAVAMGMILAAGMSLRRGLISREVHDRIVLTTKRISPGLAAWTPADDAWEIMRHDKKIRKGRMVFVLLSDVGRPLLVDDVTREEIGSVLKDIGD